MISRNHKFGAVAYLHYSQSQNVWTQVEFGKFAFKKNHEETYEDLFAYSKKKERRSESRLSKKILRSEETTNSERVAYSPHVVCHKTPNYARSFFFFRVCVTPAGHGLRPGRSVHDEHIHTCAPQRTSKIRRCRYHPLGNHLARVATYGIMKVRAREERGEELGECERGPGEEGEGPERREWKGPGLQGAARDQVSV